MQPQESLCRVLLGLHGNSTEAFLLKNLYCLECIHTFPYVKGWPHRDSNLQGWPLLEICRSLVLDSTILRDGNLSLTAIFDVFLDCVLRSYRYLTSEHDIHSTNIIFMLVHRLWRLTSIRATAFWISGLVNSICIIKSQLICRYIRIRNRNMTTWCCIKFVAN